MNTNFAKPAAVILGLAAVLGLSACGKPAPTVNPAPLNALGEVAGEEAARLAGPGGKVLLLAPGAGSPTALWIEPVLQSFAAALTRHGKVAIVATEKVKARLDDPSPTREDLTAGEFDRLLRGPHGAGAVVSFVGFPILNEAETAALKNRKIKLMAIYTAGPEAGPHYQKLLAARGLDLAILPRMEPPADAVPQPTTPRDLFHRQYQLATPDAAAQLP